MEKTKMSKQHIERKIKNVKTNYLQEKSLYLPCGRY